MIQSVFFHNDILDFTVNNNIIVVYYLSSIFANFHFKRIKYELCKYH